MYTSHPSRQLLPAAPLATRLQLLIGACCLQVATLISSRQLDSLLRKQLDEVRISIDDAIPEGFGLILAEATHIGAIVVEKTYPSQPCTTVVAKSQAPRWLQRLKELIGLKKCCNPPSINKTNNYYVSEKVGAIALMAANMSCSCGHAGRLLTLIHQQTRSTCPFGKGLTYEKAPRQRNH